MLEVDGVELRRLRLLRGLSQRDLADAAGVRQGTVSSLERGQRARASTVRVIASALGVGIGEFAHVTA